MKTPRLFAQLVAGGTFTLGAGDVRNPGFGYVARLETFAGVLRTRGTSPIGALAALETALDLGVPFTPAHEAPAAPAPVPHRSPSDWTEADEAKWKREQEPGRGDFSGPFVEEPTMLSKPWRGW